MVNLTHQNQFRNALWIRAIENRDEGVRDASVSKNYLGKPLFLSALLIY